MTQPALFVEPTALKLVDDEERDDFCRCGHSRDHHADGARTCLYGMHARVFDPETKKYRSGACGCRKFLARKRAPISKLPAYERPAAGVDWYRGPPELVRRKLGGWFVRGAASFLGFIANAKIDSYNAIMKRAGAHPNPGMARQLIAGDANKRKGQLYRTTAMLEQARVGELGAPKSATMTRIGSPRIRDDDNLVPSMKHVRDGIAEALGFDDSRFNIGGNSGGMGDIPLFYKQVTAGKRKTYAILVEIAW